MHGVVVRYGQCPSATALPYPTAAEVVAALGNRAGAAVFAHAAERVAQSFQSSAWTAMAESARGSLALTDADPGGARERFLSAARLSESAHQPFWSARCKLQAASNGAGSPADRYLLDDAATVFEQLGAPRMLAQRNAGIEVGRELRVLFPRVPGRLIAPFRERNEMTGDTKV